MIRRALTGNCPTPIEGFSCFADIPEINHFAEVVENRRRILDRFAGAYYMRVG
jgi:hypothetical protein